MYIFNYTSFFKFIIKVIALISLLEFTPVSYAEGVKKMIQFVT